MKHRNLMSPSAEHKCKIDAVLHLDRLSHPTTSQCAQKEVGGGWGGGKIIMASRSIVLYSSLIWTRKTHRRALTKFA